MVGQCKTSIINTNLVRILSRLPFHRPWQISSIITLPNARQYVGFLYAIFNIEWDLLSYCILDRFTESDWIYSVFKMVKMIWRWMICASVYLSKMFGLLFVCNAMDSKIWLNCCQLKVFPFQISLHDYSAVIQLRWFSSTL